MNDKAKYNKKYKKYKSSLFFIVIFYNFWDIKNIIKWLKLKILKNY